MTILVAAQFEAFKNRYVLPQSTMDSISTRYKRITRQLNTDFRDTTSETAHSRYVGSYGRDTAAKGVSDVDMCYALPVSMYHQYNGYLLNGQSALLQAVRTSIQNTYPSTSLKGDGQVVVVDFTDGITFEILPVFRVDDGTMTFPDSNGGGAWKSCNPDAEMKAFAERNAACNNNLKAICRMARIWKDYHSVPISGMLIDTLAYAFIASWPHRDKSYLYHDFLVRDFFEYLSNIDRDQEWWRAPGSGSWVRKIGNFQSKAKIAYSYALEAIAAETAGRSWSCTNNWQNIFGTVFPNE